jgi:predicted phosphodiesterase
MRLAVLADIHGNLPALKTVLADARRHGVEGHIVAGDFADGPQAPEVLQVLHSLRGWMIRGNRENYFLAYDAGQAPDSWHASDQWAGFRWMYDRLGRKELLFLASLPQSRIVSVDGADAIHAVHGSLHNASGLVLPDGDPTTLQLYREAGLLDLPYRQTSLGTALAEVDEPVLVCAHSHIPWKESRGDQMALNPGSVGAPINGDPRAQYALLTWELGRWQVDHRALPYDIDRTRKAYHNSGVLEAGGAMAQAFLLCVETGQNVPGRYIAHVRRLARQAGYRDLDGAPETLWKLAADSFDWAAAGHARKDYAKVGDQASPR